MHSCQDIEENRYFSNGGTNLHIHAIAQGRPEDNQVEFLQGPHGIVNPPKNRVLNNIRRFTQMTNGLKADSRAFAHNPRNFHCDAYVGADHKSTWALKTKPCASCFDFRTCVYFHVYKVAMQTNSR